ncbi:FtsX-like permease family protein [Dactylosporangium sp. CA-092794]|uniref:FtsX-like permease family protein n=1 Tax=Dactylosporangium sp. CA-092794 TaxID=3239929 RepID=UPI003D917426
MWRLALRMGGRRIAALFAMACATLGGAALITGTGVLAESGLRAHVPAGRLGGADIVVAADQAYHQPEEPPIALPERVRVPADLAGRLSRLPGVTAAVGDVSFPAAVLDGAGRPVPLGDPRVAGHAWSSTALLDRPRIDGAAPAAPDQVALDAAAGAHPGDRVRLVVNGVPGTYRVTAVVSAPGAGILFADETARNRAGAVDLVGLRVDGDPGPVADAVRRELAGTGLVVATGAGRGDLAAPATAAGRSVLLLVSSSLAGITLLIVGFIVAGAMTVSIGGQRRELALLRAVGATPRQVRRLAALQASAVTAAALVPGAALGYLLADRFRRLLVHSGLLPDALPPARSPLPALATALLLAAVVQVAARSAAWRTSRRPATEAVAESRAEPRRPSAVRAATGLLLIAAGTALSVVPLIMANQAGAAATSLSGIVIAIGLALAGPDLVRRAGAALARRLPERAAAPTWLAVSNSHGYAMRSAGAVATLALAVIFVLTYTLTQTTVMAATSGQLRAGTRAQLSVSAPGLGGVPDDVLPALAALPGVQAVAPVGTTTVLWPSGLPGDTTVTDTTALVLTPAAPAALDLGVRSGTLADLTGDTIAVADDSAAAQHLAVGRPAEVVLGDGTRATARVVAVYTRGLGFGPVVLSRDLAAGHLTTELSPTVLVRTDGSPAARAALTALAAARPGLLVDATTGPAGLGGTPPQVWINLAVLGVLIGYLLLGIANKLIAATAARRTELAALRLIGTTPRQIRAMMRREAALVTVYALGAGTALATVPLVLLGVAFLGRPWAAGPAWLLPAVAATVAAIAFLATEIPTRYALRTPPAQAIAIRE